MQEKEVEVLSGGLMLVIQIILTITTLGMFISGVTMGSQGLTNSATTFMVISAILFVIWCTMLSGYFVLQPNEAVAFLLFGDYKGTTRKAGWYFTNPFYTKRKISLRSKNLNGEKLKVNDEMGNPIEIAAVIVWRVENTVKALFEVENYVEYVRIQSESALRHLAGMYPYDATEEHHDISLRTNSNEVAESLKNELQEKLSKAGVMVEEARLSHLAYATEIAAVMLQRQQATAIIAARQKIVEGAVGMVQMAIDKLSGDGIVELDEERKAAMVSNLLVVLCGEKAAQPVVNAGTLYS